jgi:hypothetical protein
VQDFPIVDNATIRGVHLFDGSRLIANLVTTRDEPERAYDLDGQVWIVVEVRRILEDDGTEGFDLQVEEQLS